MNNSGTEIEQWLIAGTLETANDYGDDVWVANFDVDRQVVFSQLGPYKKLFLRPEKYVKRFYHTLYPLLIEDWQISEQTQLFDGFCTINTRLDIRFQATFAYAQSHREVLSKINELIKNTYFPVIIDLIKKELLNLRDDAWVREGLGKIEKAIALAVNEILAMGNIQSQATCAVKASFADFPDVQLGKESLYLSVLKKSYEVTELNRNELFRQHQIDQEQQLAHQQKQLAHYAQAAELERLQQAQAAEHQKRLLQDQEQQLQEQLAIQARLHMEKVQHESRLKEREQEVELEQKQQQEQKIKIVEQATQAETLKHQLLFKQQEIQVEIEKYKLEQASWLAAKAEINQLQLDYEQRQEQRRIELQEQNYQAMQNSDIYLRREIELLELDKKRIELQLEIQANKKDSNIE
jgi:hypothetical protein